MSGRPIAVERPGVALTRGAARLLRDLGHAVVTEFALASGRRVDVMGLDARGCLTVVEVKSSVADFRADGKWREYRAWCDAFYFAVPTEFPRDLLPDDCGLMVVDAWGGAVLRDAPAHPLGAARRKAVLVRFAMGAARRWHDLVDPASGVRLVGDSGLEEAPLRSLEHEAG